MPRPFRFGVLAGRPESQQDWADGARTAAQLGYSTWLASDHLAGGIAPMPALAAAAEAAPIRVGTFVLANDFRHPALVAKEAATIDLLSDGRFELGIGTGWMEDDYQTSGIALEPPAVRVERLMEAVAVIKHLWAATETPFEGVHYRVSMIGFPSPIQAPHPPLLIAGSGPRLLRFAARLGQTVSITATLGQRSQDGLWEAVVRSGTVIARQVEWIRSAATDTPELNVLVHHVEVTDEQPAAADRIGREVGADGEAALSSPHLLIGSHEEITEALIERRDTFGLSYIVVGRRAMRDMAPVVARLAGT